MLSAAGRYPGAGSKVWEEVKVGEGWGGKVRVETGEIGVLEGMEMEYVGETDGCGRTPQPANKTVPPPTDKIFKKSRRESPTIEGEVCLCSMALSFQSK
jgi:hypothetical protein